MRKSISCNTGIVCQSTKVGIEGDKFRRTLPLQVNPLILVVLLKLIYFHSFKLWCLNLSCCYHRDGSCLTCSQNGSTFTFQSVLNVSWLSDHKVEKRIFGVRVTVCGTKT